jgi:hypothetical protein
MSCPDTKEPPTALQRSTAHKLAHVNSNRRNFHPSAAGRQALPIGGAR